MKIKKGFVLEEVAGSYLCCATGKLAKEFGGFIKLNDTGAFLWNLLREDTTVAEMTDKMIAEYDISREIAERDISLFIKKLEENGILA